MTTFTDTEAERRLSVVLDLAKTDGEVQITGADGTIFAVRPVPRSPLDVGWITLDPPLTADEIVSLVREGRERA